MTTLTRSRRPPVYGLLAKFGTPQALIAAAKQVREAGYVKIDAFTPYPIEELSHALDLPRSKMPLVVLGGGVTGLLAGYGLQYWSQVIEYPMNIGGRPFHSWPAFIIPAFETTILFAAVAAVLGMFALNGLPQPYHPVFNAPGFAHASRDCYFLLIEARDEKFDRDATARFLRDLNPSEVSEVAP